MKDFIPYQEALALKELGFDEPCFAFFQVEYAESKPTMVDDEHEYRTTGYRTCKNSEIPQHYTSAPTYSQTFKFFREKYRLHQYIKQYYGEHFYFYIEDMVYPRRWDEYTVEMLRSFNESTSQEEAELACLKQLIELVKNKEK